MVKKVIFALINFLSIAIIAAAVAVLCIVLMTIRERPRQS